MSVRTSSRVPAATRALAVLRFLAAQPGPASAVAVARALGVPRSTTYHLLSVMAEDGFVVHIPEEQRWGLGVTAFEVGSAYLRHDPLERLARPVLARVVDELGATVAAVGHLGILHGRETLYLLKEQPRRPVTLVTDVGVRLPAHLTASGRAMLAHLPRPQLRALFPSQAAFVDRTGRGPATLTELRRVLAAERAQGYAVEDGFVTVGYASVACAAFDHLERPVAAIGVTFQRESAPEPIWPGIATRVSTAAAKLTDRLGGRVPGSPRRT